MALTEYIPSRAKEALALASVGLKVFPLHGISDGRCTCGKDDCKSPGKHPRTMHGIDDASSDPDQIKAWFGSGIKNIGIRTGDGFWVLDFDPKSGGMEQLAEWEAEHGKLDAAWIAQSGSGGLHYYFAGNCRSSASRVGKGVDTRGDGGLIVAPPSDHVAGKPYRWHKDKRPGLKDLFVAPDWLLVLIEERLGRGEKVDVTAAVAGVAEGSRNETIFKLTASNRAQAVPFEVALAQAEFAASRCNPPLPMAEVKNIVEGVYQRYKEGRQSIAVIEVRGDDERKSFPLTDVGNAERLLWRLDDSVRWCHAFGKWLVWDGTIWRVDETGGAILVQEAVRMVRDLADAGDNAYEKQEIAKWAKACESNARIRSMVDLAKSFAPISPEELDQEPMLMGVANGTLNLATGKLQDAKKEDYITQSSPVAFDPEAECPTFERFMTWIVGNDADLGQYLQMALGYTLTGLTSEQCLFFAHGGGANGKSTLFDAVMHVLGTYARTIPSDELMAQGFGGSIESTLARIKGARAVFCAETSNKMLNESTVKELSAGNVVQARMKYGHPFEFRPICKIWMTGNHKPKVTGTDHGIWRRIRLIPFEQTVSDAERDVRLLDKLIAEGPGILRFMMVGLEHFLNDGSRLPQCRQVMVSTDEYRSEQDVLGQFIDEACEIGAGESVGNGELYASYVAWSKANGHMPFSHTAFSLRVQERGYEKVRDMNLRKWQGIGLSPETRMGSQWWQQSQGHDRL